MTQDASREARSSEPAPRGSLTPEYLLDRRRRWLLEHFRSDRDVVNGTDRTVSVGTLARERVTPTARCWCCGKLLGKAALFVSLTDPTKGTRTNNLRPACHDHASTL